MDWKEVQGTMYEFMEQSLSSDSLRKIVKMYMGKINSQSFKCLQKEDMSSSLVINCQN